MAVERAPGGSSLIDVLDRILDKGIVIDAWVRISLVGIDLITVEARVVIASIDTYLKYAEAVGAVPTVSRPGLGPATEEPLGGTTATTSRPGAPISGRGGAIP
jgi:hypothetical protein